MPKINRESLQAAVMNQVEHGSKIYTDEAKVYRSLPKEYLTNSSITSRSTLTGVCTRTASRISGVC